MKKLIVITSLLYFRNYLKTQAFSNIVDDDTYFICTEELAGGWDQEVYGDLYGVINDSSHFFKYSFSVINELQLHVNKDKSKGFLKKYKLTNTALFFKSNKAKKIADSFSRFLWVNVFVLNVLEFVRPIIHLRRSVRFLLLYGLNGLGLSNFIIEVHTKYAPINKDIVRLIESINPNLILVPNGGNTEIVNDILRFSKRNNDYKTMLLVDNWDNMCSKSIYSVKPDYLGVWGDQAFGHAVRLHGFDPASIFLLGTPRFDVYYRYLNSTEVYNGDIKPPAFPYILFAGCWPPFDEISVLERLNVIIDECKDVLPGKCKILYRPHPWGENIDKLDYLYSRGLANVVVDPQISTAKRSTDWRRRTDFQPDINYYPVLLDKSEFVICPLSTVTLEASIMDKKVLVLAHDDGASLLNPAFMYENSDHFEKFDEMPSFRLLHELDQLKDLFCEMVSLDVSVSRKNLSFYLVDDEIEYPERIENIVSDIQKDIIV